MREKLEKKRLLIMRTILEAGKPIGSSKITERLRASGHDIGERTVRFHLAAADKLGLTENLGRRGRKLTQKGREEIETARVHEKVGFLAAKIDQMTYRMQFDMQNRTGAVVINVSVFEADELLEVAPVIKRVYEHGYSMGTLAAILEPGEQVGSIVIGPGELGLGTVCSITLNGVLLKNGVPVSSRFGGLLEMVNHKPSRFVEIIRYEGTSLDPLEIFIRSGMTDYSGATETGNGLIGASFRELPAESRDLVVELADRLTDIGLGGFMLIGWPSQPLLDIPVAEGRIGAVVIGGLNPVAIIEERGVRIKSRALAGLIEYRKLFHYSELEDRIKSAMK